MMGLYQNRIVVKVGTSTLTNENGKTDLNNYFTFLQEVRKTAFSQNKKAWYPKPFYLHYFVSVRTVESTMKSYTRLYQTCSWTP